MHVIKNLALLINLTKAQKLYNTLSDQFKKNELLSASAFRYHEKTNIKLTDTGNIRAKYNGHCFAMSTTFFLIVILCCVL